MDSKQLSKVCEQIYRRFPEVAGSPPKVQTQPGEQVLLVFHGKSKTADGHTIARTVRVVAGSSGKIVKVTTSR
jgi:hypothetical protein